MKSKNLTFSEINKDFAAFFREEKRIHHGGSHSTGRRKTRRPLSTRKPIHLVMRSEIARGAMSFRLPKHKSKIGHLISRYSTRFNVKVYRYSVNSNHLHLVVRAKTRKSFQDFLRSLSGVIGRFMLAAEKGAPKGKFWDSLAFTRISEWGKAFRTLNDYVIQNVLEAAGVIAYKPRRKPVKHLVTS